MDAMHDLSAHEITRLQGSNLIYLGVQLLGYYEKRDTWRRFFTIPHQLLLIRGR